MKILSVFGTRPEAIKMAPVVNALTAHFGKHDARVCVTAQHRGMLDSILKLFSIHPDYDLNIMKPDQDLTDVSTRVLINLRSILRSFKPDRVLVHGDTTTTLSAGLASFYEKIPVAHVEAGLRSHNLYSPWPEELNRRFISMISDLHFAPTDTAVMNLRNEGIEPEHIVKTGNTVIDALLLTRNILLDNQKLLSQNEKKFSFLNYSKKIILVTGHRRESFGCGFNEICEALADLSHYPDVQIVYPVHLNPNIQYTVKSYLKNHENIFLIEPLDYLSFVFLMMKSYLIITDSGGIQEEAPSLGKPVLLLREVTERPEGIEAGTVKLIGVNKRLIISETINLLDNEDEYKKMSLAHNPYGDGKATLRIINKLKEVDSEFKGHSKINYETNIPTS